MPISPIPSPRKRLNNALASERPTSPVTAVKASTISAKYSAGLKRRAIPTSSGAKKVSAIVAMLPATKEPSAAVASAAPPRPRFAI